MSEENRPSHSSQFVDVRVSKLKFKEEFDKFLHAKDIHRKRGIILLDAVFPNIRLAFCAPALSPPAIAFAVCINFDNYDLEPLSVSFINPFTFELVNGNQVPTKFLRKREGMNPPFIQLLQQEPSGLPFICLPGIREYHSHPFHTGDSWFLHRKVDGEGSLGYIIDKLYEYGISSLSGFVLNVQINANGLQLAAPFEKLPA